MVKLRPCPFCGGKAIMKQTPYSQFARVYSYVTCESCSAKSGYHSKPSLATDAWNNREGKSDV